MERGREKWCKVRADGSGVGVEEAEAGEEFCVQEDLVLQKV